MDELENTKAKNYIKAISHTMTTSDASSENQKIVALILGNGFDIANNFKTSYSDFVESEQFKTLLERDNKLAKHIYGVKKLYNWVDVEIELGNYSYHLQATTQATEQISATNQFLAEFKSLKKALYIYINSMTTSIVNPKMESLIDEWLNYTLPNYNIKLFIVNFNYNLWDHIRLFNNAIRENLLNGQPLHIHGKTDYSVEESDKIVLGVDKTNQRGSNHNFIVKAYDTEAKDKIYFNNIQSASKYIIFGCSIGSTDMRYFKPIFQKSKDKEFEIYGYGEIGMADIQNNISEICDYDEFKTNNNVRILDSSEFS